MKIKMFIHIERGDCLEEMKKQLLVIGKQMFSTKGFKKTGIKDIAGNADIAVGTFYNYFDSKEELFLEIYLQESNKLKQAIAEKIDINKEPADVIVETIHLMIDKMENNPILKEFFDREQYKKIINKLSPEIVKKNYEMANSLFAPFLNKWKKEGNLKKIDNNMLIAIMDTIFHIYSHRKDIGEDFFPELLDFYIESVAKNLFEK